ncbi:MAG: hypothetical protein ACXW1W_00195, partial [Methylococcaceae bacterium]
MRKFSVATKNIRASRNLEWTRSGLQQFLEDLPRYIWRASPISRQRNVGHYAPLSKCWNNIWQRMAQGRQK